MVMTNLDTIIEQRNLPGILLFDRNGSLLLFNREAEGVVPTLRTEQGGESRVPDAILELLEELKRGAGASPTGNRSTSSYRVLYSESGVHLYIRAFFVRSPDEGEPPGRMMVLVEKVIERHRINLEKARKKFDLSRRETEVVKHICQGLSNRDISDKLFISEYTVKDHIKKIMKTMNAASRSEIIAILALKEG